VLHCTRLKRLERDKHSSFGGPFVRCDENEVSRIGHLVVVDSVGVVPVPVAVPALAHHVGEELGETEQRTLSHRTERLEHLLLHVERVHPQRDAPFEVAHVGVDGAAVADVVGRVGVGGAEDSFADLGAVAKLIFLCY